MHVPVALVLDPSFGDRVAVLAQKMPVWMVSSVVNDHATHAARQSLGNGQITTLHTRLAESAESLFARALYAIEEHHGDTSQLTPYDTLCVYGKAQELPFELASELGFKSITTTEDGFNAEK